MPTPLPIFDLPPLPPCCSRPLPLLLVAGCALLFANPGCTPSDSRNTSGTGSNATTGTGATDGQSKSDNPETMKIAIADKVFSLELALDSPARIKGLSGRSDLAEDEGMLFVFPTSQRELSFVMRDCLIPIDIIFLSSQGTVVATHEMTVEPLETRSDPAVNYNSKWPAQFAIELRSGSIRELKIQEGQKIELPIDQLVPRASN